MTLKQWPLTGTPGAQVNTGNSGLDLVNSGGGLIRFVDPVGVEFITSETGGYTIARGAMAAFNNRAAYLGKFTCPPPPAADLDFGRIRHTAGDAPVIRFVIKPDLKLQLWDNNNDLIGGADLAYLVEDETYQLSVVVDTSTDGMFAQLYTENGAPVGIQLAETADLGGNPVAGFEIGVSSQNPSTRVVWRKVQMDDGRVSEIQPDMPPVDGDHASATCEVWIDGQSIPCTREELASGQPTILDPLTIQWGRQNRWDQPDAGSASFVIQDQRTNPQPIGDIIHVGSKVDVFAEAPEPDPQPVTYGQDFESATILNGSLSQNYWRWEQLPAALNRTNLYPDPNITTTSGKSTGGSSTNVVDSAWKDSGAFSMRNDPNGSSNASAIYLYTSGANMNGFTAGSNYTISATMRLDSAQAGSLSDMARQIVVSATVGGSTNVIATSAAPPNVAGTIQRVVVSFALDPDTTGVNIRLFNGSPTTSIWWDSILITQGGQDAHEMDRFFDGNSSAAGYEYEWTGATNNSSSTERYLVSDPTSNIIIYDDETGPTTVGEGSKSAWLLNWGTRVAYRIAPGMRWGTPWVRSLRPVASGEVWEYSFMFRAPVGVPISVTLLGYSSSWGDGESITLTMDGSLGRTIVGTGNWETYTGTFANNTFPSVPRWPVMRIQVPPEANGGDDSFSQLDAITYTGPPLDVQRVQVWAGRVTDLAVELAESSGTAITIDVTCAGEIAEIENVSIGDTPWFQENTNERIDRIISLIPAPVEEFSASRDDLRFEVVQPRDIDSQPALGLLRDYASMVLGVVWPVNIPGARNHAWIENSARRITGWSGPVGQISACDIPRGQVQVSQSGDQVVTVADVSWLSFQGPDEGNVEMTYTLIDDEAAERFGARRFDLRTEFNTEAAAIRAAEMVMDITRASDWALTGMEFDTRNVLNTGNHAQRLLMQLLNSATRPGSWISVVDLPEWIPGSLASGFVEGGTIVYTSGWWEFDLFMSATGV